MNTNKRLILHTEASRGWGGQEIRILEELRHMPRFGLNTALAAPKASRIFHVARDEGIPTYAIDFDSKRDLASFSQLLQLFGRLKPTVVNTHSSIDSWMAGLAAKLRCVPVVLRTRHVSTPIGSAASYRLFPTAVLTTSEAIRQHLIQRGLIPEKVVTLPTGIALDRFNFSQNQRQKMRASLNLTDEHVLVGNVCILRSWKGLDFFVETAAQMPDPYRFIIIGDGPQRENLKQQATRLGIEKRIIFTGYQSFPENYLSALDIFYFTSYASEGISQSLIQALCAGLPIVACPTPSTEEILKKVSGVKWVKYGETTAACKMIADSVLPKVESDRRATATTRQVSLAAHSLDAMTKRLQEVYVRLGVFNPDVALP